LRVACHLGTFDAEDVATADQQRTTRQPCTGRGEANIPMPCEIAAIKKPVALHFVSELKLLAG
jgi:hypothetical protein